MDTKNQKPVSQQLGDTIGLSGEHLDEIGSRLKEIKERTSELVQKHPLTSIAIALGIGFFIGKILAGRRS